MKRIAQVIRVRPEKLGVYRQLHLNPWKAVAEEISACNIRNYSIYLYGDVLFSYFEYVGQDYEADMRKMAEHEQTRLWWSLTDPWPAARGGRRRGRMVAPDRRSIPSGLRREEPR